MAEQAHQYGGGLRVNSVDRRGRQISPAVLNAAEEIGRRALRHAEKMSIDSAVATNLLEEAAATVSRAMSARSSSQRPIQNLNSYLFRAFIRRVNKRYKQELSSAESLRAHAREMPDSIDPRLSIDNKILIDEFLADDDGTVTSRAYVIGTGTTATGIDNTGLVTGFNVPEPGTFVLLGSGALGMAGVLRRRLGC